MRTVIIPDIHTKTDAADAIIGKESPDRVVFLGDYFDDFGDSVETTYETARWLRESMERQDRTHLLGNHDLSYLDPTQRCSGFSEAKLYAIKKAGVDLSKLERHTWVGEWLCTHAGLSQDTFDAVGKRYPKILDIDQMIRECDEILYSCTIQRGGRDEFPGILWCDYDEFEDLEGTKQVFGHTAGDIPRKSEGLDSSTDTGHICLDTHLNHYAVFDGKRMDIRPAR